MDLWNTYHAARAKPDYSLDRVYIRVRNRIDTSLASVDYSRREVNPGEAASMAYAPEHRYLTASNVTFELLVSIYDVNSQNYLLLRPTQPFGRDELESAREFVRKQRFPNIEVRLIGLQSRAGNIDAMLDGVNGLQKAVGGNLMEVDLFGSNVRNLAFDTRTGLSYDLLLLNKIYGPHELENTAKEEDFRAKASKLKFV